MANNDSDQQGQNDPKSKAWDRIMGVSLGLPGVKVDRDSFLRSQLQNYCDEIQVKKAIKERPANGGISPKAAIQVQYGTSGLIIRD